MSDDWHWVVLNVNPEPWRIGPVVTGRKGGKIFGNVGRDQQLHAYQEAVKEAIGNATVWIEGPIELQFWFWRSRAEYKTPQARTARKNEADGTNMQKATEDALQGVFFKNDKDVVKCQFNVIEQGEDTHGKVVIGIRQAPPVATRLSGLPAAIRAQVEALDEVSDDNWNEGPEIF